VTDGLVQSGLNRRIQELSRKLDNDLFLPRLARGELLSELENLVKKRDIIRELEENDLPEPPD
jgi:hypothetical protein